MEPDASLTPLPLGRSGKYARRAQRVLVGLVAAVTATVAFVVLGLQSGVLPDPVAVLAFLHVLVVFGEQTWSLQLARGDLGAVALLLAAFGAVLAQPIFGLAAGSWDIRLFAVMLSAATYLYLVRGHGYVLQRRSLDGRVCLITGCNTGIGLTTAEVMARAGARVIFACRNEAKAREAMKQVLASCKGIVKEEQLVFIAPLDLGSLKSIRAFVTKFRLLATMRNLELHHLILNAGAIYGSRTLSDDGIEMTFAANHLGHFLLTNLLLPQMRTLEKLGELPRIVVVGSSTGFGHEAFDFSEAVAAAPPAKESLASPPREELLARPFEMFHAYGQSKFANMLFATELVRRLRKEGSKIPVCVVHPGSINTEIARNMPELLYRAYQALKPVLVVFFKTPYQGCLNTVFAATSQQITSSAPSNDFLYVDRLAVSSPNEAARDAEAARRLWSVSEKLAGVGKAEAFGGGQ
eukprot:TRINITY_DN23050_c0_g2_i1.p1 TRINITY_DN23050_c0_g2~~TRINITY_DN23050_c0_g2_i1.p1  ORF type:complete len:482 (-),score=120.42 TRINITY_DN23050_c0_g2_i1:87-1481(-)